MFVIKIDLLIFIIISINLVSLTLGQDGPTAPCINHEIKCTGIPSECAFAPGFTCISLVLMKYDDAGNLDVDIYGAKVSGTYHALGFGPNQAMDGLSVIHCDYTEDGSVSIGEGYNSQYNFNPITSSTIAIINSTDVHDEFIHCSFKIKSMSTVTETITLNLAERQWVSLATGPVTTQGISVHTMKGLSPTYTDLTDKTHFDIIIQ